MTRSEKLCFIPPKQPAALRIGEETQPLLSGVRAAFH